MMTLINRLSSVLLLSFAIVFATTTVVGVAGAPTMAEKRLTTTTTETPPAAFVNKIPRGGGSGVYGTDITKKNLAAVWTGVCVASSIVAIPAPEIIGQAYGIEAKPDTQPYYFLEGMATTVSQKRRLSVTVSSLGG